MRCMNSFALLLSKNGLFLVFAEAVFGQILLGDLDAPKKRGFVKIVQWGYFACNPLLQYKHKF